MIFLRPDELKTGQILAKPIYNKQGVLLYDRGSALTGPIIDSVRKFGLIGVLVLEPAEPLAPVSAEELEFEQLQTQYMFRLRDCLVSISKGENPEDFKKLANDIVGKYGIFDHKALFTQTMRSADDYNYKHSVCCAILCALVGHRLNIPKESMEELVEAALLADFGYLYVPREIMTKPETDLSGTDLITIEQYRNKAFSLLKTDINPFGLHPETIRIATEFLKVPRKEDTSLDVSGWILSTKILMVVDKYDRMTAMSINRTPESGVAAIKHMQSTRIYEPFIVKALSDSLSVLPVGASVKLSNKARAMILNENDDALNPRLLDLDTNKIYDLSDPETRAQFEVADLQQSMDMRYDFDEETIKQFVPDEALSNLTRRFRVRLANIRKREAGRVPRANTRPVGATRPPHGQGGTNSRTRT